MCEHVIWCVPSLRVWFWSPAVLSFPFFLLMIPIPQMFPGTVGSYPKVWNCWLVGTPHVWHVFDATRLSLTGTVFVTFPVFALLYVGVSVSETLADINLFCQTRSRTERFGLLQECFTAPGAEELTIEVQLSKYASVGVRDPSACAGGVESVRPHIAEWIELCDTI